jgi:hypothetical protein
MADTEEKRADHAATAGEDGIKLFVHDPSPRVLRSLLLNSLLHEDDVLIIANRKNVSAEILEIIARDKRWAASYPVKLALVRNPRSPLSVSLSLARFLRIFDLEEITRNPLVPIVLRHKIAAMIIERVPTMPLGNKKTLARKAAGSVLVKLLQERIPEVVLLCLDNPHLVEGHLYRIINRADCSPKTILSIADHPRWSNRPLIRFALVRSPHTPLTLSDRFLKQMRQVDLRELFSDPSLPVTVRPLVHRELRERGIDPEKAGDEEVYEIREEEPDLDAERIIRELDGRDDISGPEDGQEE